MNAISDKRCGQCTVMNPGKDGCLICGADLEYLDEAESMTCIICGKTFGSNAHCSKGHYVCDDCHSSSGNRTIRSVCLSTDSADPIAVALECMALPEVHMHGPEHHTLVASAILTACHNAGVQFDLPTALNEAARRASQVPGGVCGNWGCCGAAVGAGIATSILTGATPLSGNEWGVCNTVTGTCLQMIGGMGGPRCCKRDSFTAIITASMYLESVSGVVLEYMVPTCTFHERNQQCQGASCPYNPEHVE